MITLFLTLCYYLFIWPFVMMVRLFLFPFKLMLWALALPFRLLGWVFTLPGRLLFPGRYACAEEDDTMDDFLDWVEEYECLTDDEQ